MSIIENKKKQGEITSKANKKNESLENRSKLECLNIPSILVIDDYHSLNYLSKPLFDSSKNIPTLSHMHQVSYLKKPQLPEHEIIKIDLLGSPNGVKVPEISKKLKELANQKFNCKTPKAATLASLWKYPHKEIESLVGASPKELASLKPREILEILDSKISSHSPLSSNKENKQQHIRVSLKEYLKAAIRLEDRGISLFIAAGNIEEKDEERHINLLSLAGTTVTSVNAEGEISSFSYVNELVDYRSLGEYTPNLTREGLDLNNDGVTEVPIDVFLKKSGLEHLSTALLNPQSIETISVSKKDLELNFNYMREIYASKLANLKDEALDKGNFSKQRKAYFGVNMTKLEQEMPEGSEGSVDFEVAHQLLQMKPGFYDIQQIKSYIGLPRELNPKAFVYKDEESNKLFYISEIPGSNKFFLSEGSLAQFDLIKREGTSFTLINAIFETELK